MTLSRLRSVPLSSLASTGRGAAWGSKLRAADEAGDREGAHERPSRWSDGGYTGASCHGGNRSPTGVNPRTVEQVPVPQTLEETVEVLAPTERVQQRTVDVPLPQMLEETVQMVRSASHERVQHQTSEQNVDVPQIAEETVELVRLDPQETLCQCHTLLFFTCSDDFLSGHRHLLRNVIRTAVSCDCASCSSRFCLAMHAVGGHFHASELCELVILRNAAVFADLALYLAVGGLASVECSLSLCLFLSSSPARESATYNQATALLSARGRHSLYLATELLSARGRESTKSGLCCESSSGSSMLLMARMESLQFSALS